MSASLRQALERELADNPDDLATCAAYADLLDEMGDPRGEYIQVQLSLEDPDLSPAQRKQLTARENELWLANGADWLGAIGPALGKHDDFTIRRGWLHSLAIGDIKLPFSRTLRDAPEARMLQRLEFDWVSSLEDETREPGDNIPEEETWPGLWPLVGADTLRNVRSFRVGPDDGDDYDDFASTYGSDALIPIIRGMPHLEELTLRVCIPAYMSELFALTTLDNLRILKLYHCNQVHRLDILANNRHLHSLTHLLLHPHALDWKDRPNSRSREQFAQDEADGFRKGEGYLPLRVVQALIASKHLPHLTHLQLRCSSAGDDGVRALVEGGLYQRLKSLDLRHGCVTDVGARQLLDSPHTRTLERLDLSHNVISAEMVAALEKLGIRCELKMQQTGEYEEGGYLYEGDQE